MATNHSLVEAYLRSTSMVQQQIDSYNRFVNIGIHKIVETNDHVEPDVSDFAIKFKGVRLEQPTMIESNSSARRVMPNEAHVRNLTYSSPIYITYVPMISGIEKIDATSEAFIGELPVMVKSDICYTKRMTREQLVGEGEDPDDPGGYFIIKGAERVLVGFEDLAPNKIICTREGEKVMSKVFSTTYGFRARCSVTRDEYGLYTVLYPTLQKGLDLPLVLRALGMTSEDMLAAMSNKEARNDMILNNDMSAAKEMNQKQALAELGRLAVPTQTKEFQEKRAEVQLDTYILPRIGITVKERKLKALYLLRMAERASLIAYGHAKPDDRDNYSNKRIKLAGDMMEELFNSSFKFFLKDLKYHVERTIARGRKLNIRASINPETLTEKILYSMGTGSWPGGQTGVSQVLDRMNYVSSLAHLRRVKSPLAKKHPHFRARDVHGSHIGKLCPSETPESTEVGLTRYMALMCKVTVGADTKMIEDKIKELKLVEE